jgi:hypothetical protein
MASNEDFAARLELCLAKEGLFISNKLFEMTDQDVMTSFFMANDMPAAWTALEDVQLLHDYRIWGLK